MLPASRVPPPSRGHQIGARKRRTPENTILSQPYCRRVSTDRPNRESSQLAASLEGEPGPTPAGKTLPHSYPKTRFRRERVRNLISRDGFGSPVPRQPAHLHTQAESGAYGIPPEFRGGVHLFIYNRHTSSGRSRVYRVTQLRTDGVHCRESAGTGPVNLKVVPNKCCLGRSPWTK